MRHPKQIVSTSRNECAASELSLIFSRREETLANIFSCLHYLTWVNGATNTVYLCPFVRPLRKDYDIVKESRACRQATSQ